LLFLHAYAQAQQIVPNGATSASATTTPRAVPSAYPSTAPLNYVRTWVLQKPLTDAAQVTTASASDAVQQTQYLDGLGQPVQMVSRAVSPNGKDMVAPSIYDAFGREPVKYLPYTSTTSDGSFQANPFNSQAAFMQQQYSSQGEQFFYGLTNFEASPLNRPVSSLAAGNSWVGSGQSIQVSSEFNSAGEVRIWTIAGTHAALPSSAGYYAAGQLSRTVTTDENGKRVVEYKDKDGAVVLKKVELANNAAIGSHTGWLCTYYIYDDLGRLRSVLSPKAVEQVLGTGTVNSEIADGLCFRYEYDYRNRMINKKVPGAAETWMVYDARDRVVFTQDGNMHAKNWWMVTLYDVLNRPAVAGIMVYSGTYEQLAAYAADPAHLQGTTTIAVQDQASVSSNLVFSSREIGRTLYQASVSILFETGFETEDSANFLAEIVNGQSSTSSYVVAGNPLPSGITFTPLTFSFYDDYAHTQKTYTAAENSKLDAGSNPYPESLPATASVATRGIATSSKVWLMQDPSDLSQGQWLESAIFYDDKGRPVQVQSNNDKGGLETSITRSDFSGRPLSTYLVHRNPQSATPETRVLTTMDYDVQGRLLTVKKKLNDAGSLKTTVQNEYDELGQLKTKHLGAGLQDIAYDYTIRGWLKSMNKDYVSGSSNTGRFGQALSYDYGFTKKQFGGNISGLQWRSVGDGERRAYGFDYDNVNRLLKADFTQYTGGWNNTAGVDFSMQIGDGVDSTTAYDANGNIRQMWQKGLLLQSSDWIDKLKYTYADSSNQLKNVVDLKNDPLTKLGDFRTSALHPQKTLKDNATNTPGSVDLRTITDYIYDVNGNMTKDLNKNIVAANAGAGIIYNHLNLPAQITVQKEGGNKGTITYIYDAAATKHQKITKELGVSVSFNDTSYVSDITTTTFYEGSFTYETKSYTNPALSALNKADQLQFLAQEEGRIRPTGDTAVPFVYDYFIKDHLGNVRMVLTDEQKVDKYPVASLEDSKVGTESKYYAITNSQIVSDEVVTGLTAYTNDNGIGNNPADAAFEGAYSHKLYKLNGNGAKTGLGITLKVMAGDKLDIFGKSYYFQNNTGGSSVNQSVPVLDILTGLLGSAGGTVATTAHTAVTPSDLNALTPTTAGIANLLSGQTTENNQNSAKPKAYINYLFFDEHFKFVSGSYSPVGANSTVKDHHSELQNIAVPKNGYVYIYCSNESPVNVFFDNLQVVHTRGPVLEETHYYPFGLAMTGISGKSAGGLVNEYKFGGKEKQEKEFENGDGLETYDFNARMQDPQLGRWWQIDPLADQMRRFSLYNYAFDNPIRFIDADGMAPEDLILGGNRAQALKDIQSMVPKELQGRVSAVNGKVNFNTEGLTESQLADPGVAALKTATDDHSRTYSYVSADDALVGAQHVNNEEDVPKVYGPIYNVQLMEIGAPKNNGISSTSKEPYGFIDKNTGKPRDFTLVPGNPNLDAELVISPNTAWVEPEDHNKGVSRPSIILHEMIEMVDRTAWGKTRDDAHLSAIDKVKVIAPGDPRYARDPGSASGIVPKQKR